MSEPTPTPEPEPRRGRKPKLTPALQAKMVEIIEDGNFVVVAVKKVGIGRVTFYRWMKTGRKFPDGIYGAFRSAIIGAITDSETNLLKAIKAWGSEDWRALAWVTERRFIQRWGRDLAKLKELESKLKDIKALTDELSTKNVGIG